MFIKSLPETVSDTRQSLLSLSIVTVYLVPIFSFEVRNTYSLSLMVSLCPAGRGCMSCCPADMGRKPSLAKFDCRCDFCRLASYVWCSILMSVYFPISGFKLLDLKICRVQVSEQSSRWYIALVLRHIFLGGLVSSFSFGWVMGHLIFGLPLHFDTELRINFFSSSSFWFSSFCCVLWVFMVVYPHPIEWMKN